MLINHQTFPRVALDIMNDVHGEEIDNLNNLAQLIMKKQEGENFDDEIEKTIGDLLNHIEYHFSNEERMMEETGFPVYAVHKGEHDRVRAEMSDICSDWRTDEGFKRFADYFLRQVPEWLLDHVATMDMVTANFLKQHGAG